MSFKDLNLNEEYDSDEEDILSDFFVPVLAQSKNYWRMAGFFSSSSLTAYSRGIGEFIRNNGKMKLLCSAKLSKRDYNIMKEVNENPSNFIEESFINDLNSIEDKFVEDHIQALGWMLANDLLEIKISVPDEDDNYSLFHYKIGIFEDFEGNFISFTGSVNESLNALLNNMEAFDVYVSWNEKDKNRVSSKCKKFKRAWNYQTNKNRIIDLPDAIKKELIDYAPENKENLAVCKKEYYKKYIEINNKNSKTKSLRDYQKEAVKKWFENGCKGLFNMATGTGKTITSLGCLKKLMNEKNNFFTVIACPQKHLIFQWRDTIKDFLDNDVFLTINDSNWYTELNQILLSCKLGNIKYPIILTTFKTFSNEKYIGLMNKYNSIPKFLLVDEVHGVGSSEYQKGFTEVVYNYYLGLSATPERWFDDEGTKIIENYFGKSVYDFDIKRAIKEGFLTEYEYIPHFIELNENEFEEYVNLTRIIAALYEENNNIEDISIKKQYLKRQSIIDNAEDKFNKLEYILDNYDVDHMLIYCADKHKNKDNKQIDSVEKILKNRNISTHQFTGDVDSTPDDEFNGLSKREVILNLFNNGTFDVLTAMRCLDEGVDVPSTKSAILMASTSNPREHIQRRGRVLRNFPGKKYAIIHDMIVYPSLSKFNNSEKRIIEKELDRYEEFAKYSKYPAKAQNLLIKRRREIGA